MNAQSHEEKTTRTIALIGSTGKAGKIVLGEALERGYRVRAIARNPEKITFRHPALTVVPGEIREREAVRLLLKGCTAAISTLGQRKGELPVISAATSLLLECMKEAGIRRYVVLTGTGIRAPGDVRTIEQYFQRAALKAMFPSVMADKQREYAILYESGLDWTLVRVPLITDGESSEPAVVDRHHCEGKTISKRALAGVLLDMIETDGYFGQAVFACLPRHRT